MPPRHTAQARLRSAKQEILQEFLRQRLALQGEAAMVHGATRCLDLRCPDLWYLLYHLPRPRYAAGAGQQSDALGSGSDVSIV
jgi:hypothetical protein